MTTDIEQGPQHVCAALQAGLAAGAADGGPFSPRRSAQLDRAEAFPAEQCTLLDEFGLSAHYVPRAWGGQLDDHEQLWRLWRAVARYDLSPIIAHGKTYLGVVSVWIAGEPEQARALAAEVLVGARVCWALSERDHGADLLAGEATARPEHSGYRLDGAKWPINNATRSSHLCLLARTDEHGGNRGHSLFMIDKTALAPGAVRALPKVRTHGIRGIDISGVVFDGAFVGASARIGAEGTGAETVLRALQITRTMCSALSVGTGEHALRLAVSFAGERVIAGRPLIERPNVRAVLARSAALLMATEAVAVMAARSIQALSKEMSVVSAAAKSLAPTLVDSVVGELAELLGLRAFLTGQLEHGAFQKLQRDHQVVAIFDGSTVVNRNALINQLPRLVRGYRAATVNAEGLAASCRLGTTTGPLDYSALTLVSRDGVSAVAGLRAAVEELAGGAAPAGLLAEARAALAVTDALHERAAALRPTARPSMAAYELAAGYELCFAASACVHLWAANAAAVGSHPLWDGALWARACLRALRLRLSRIPAVQAPAAAAALADDDDYRLTGEIVDWLGMAVAAGEPLSPFDGPRELLMEAGRAG